MLSKKSAFSIGITPLERLARREDEVTFVREAEAREKRRLLNFAVSNCTWKGGELVSTLRQPFDLLAETTAIAAQAAAGKRPILPKVRSGSPGRIRTSDQPVNSRLLYR